MYIKQHGRFEVLTVVTLKIHVFWNVITSK
jgi:hypothetical protein